MLSSRIEAPVLQEADDALAEMERDVVIDEIATEQTWDSKRLYDVCMLSL